MHRRSLVRNFLKRTDCKERVPDKINLPPAPNHLKLVTLTFYLVRSHKSRSGKRCHSRNHCRLIIQASIVRRITTYTFVLFPSLYLFNLEITSIFYFPQTCQLLYSGKKKFFFFLKSIASPSFRAWRKKKKVWKSIKDNV